MSKVERVYYKCDYCNTTKRHYSDFKYTDNSGLQYQCWDMCSDECYEKHIDYLENFIFSNSMEHNMDLKDYTLEEYIKDWIKVRDVKEAKPFKKWLLITLDDERYYFNFESTITNGTLDEVEYIHSLDKNNRREINGIYIYEKVTRTDKHCSIIDENVWEEVLKKYLDNVQFSAEFLIPFEKINVDFYLNYPIVNRNVKFGFLDIKNK